MRTRTPKLDQRILDAAAQLFAAGHFHETRMEDIATAAKVGKGTLYRYFKDKEELYLALLERAAQQIEGLTRDLKASDADPVAKLVDLVTMVLTFFKEQPHVFELIQQVEATRGTNHPWQAARDILIAEVRAIFTEMKASGTLNVSDPDLTSLVLLGGLRAVLRFGPKRGAAPLARRIVDTVLYGAGVAKKIKAPSKSPGTCFGKI